MYQPNIIYGIVVAGAVMVSAASPRLFPVMCGLTVAWLNYITSWSPWSLDMLLTTYGPVEVHSIDLWALCNCCNAILCLFLWVHNGRKDSWLVAMYLLLLSGCYIDVMWWLKWVTWASFKVSADAIFVAELAVVYLVGGRDAARVLRVCLARLRLCNHREDRTARAQAATLGG